MNIQQPSVSILFFGSTTDSVLVLETLYKKDFTIVAVVTQPPRPIGRKKIITSTPIEIWANEHTIPVYSFPSSQQSFLYENEHDVIKTLEKIPATLLISASYGQKIPTRIIDHTPFGGLNVHPSLLPRWRGADPIPWQILSGDTETGATVVTLTERMDEGKIIAQQSIPLVATDTHTALRQKLFAIGATLLADTIPSYIEGTKRGIAQNPAKAITARRLTRDDGFIPWEIIKKSLNGEVIPSQEFPIFFQKFITPTTNTAQFIVRAINALSPWPGIWTFVENKRRKILFATVKESTGKTFLVLQEIQDEGKMPQKL